MTNIQSTTTFDDARHWQRDRERILRLTRASGVPNLRVSFDDRDHTWALTDGSRSTCGELLSEAEEAISEWPGTRIVGWVAGALELEPLVRDPRSTPRHAFAFGVDKQGSVDISSKYYFEGGEWLLFESRS